MTKKEKHTAINKEFCEKYENDFDIDDEMGGRLVLIPFDCDCEPFTVNSIDYHLSRHTVDVYNWSTPEIKRIVVEMETFIDELRVKYDLPE